MPNYALAELCWISIGQIRVKEIEKNMALANLQLVISNLSFTFNRVLVALYLFP